MQDSRYLLSVDGLGSIDNVDGDLIARELGINMDNLSRDVIVIIAWVGGLFLVLLFAPSVRRAISYCLHGGLGAR
jgi:hypothetical protein